MSGYGHYSLGMPFPFFYSPIKPDNKTVRPAVLIKDYLRSSVQFCSQFLF